MAMQAIEIPRDERNAFIVEVAAKYHDDAVRNGLSGVTAQEWRETSMLAHALMRNHRMISAQQASRVYARGGATWRSQVIMGLNCAQNARRLTIWQRVIHAELRPAVDGRFDLLVGSPEPRDSSEKNPRAFRARARRQMPTISRLVRRALLGFGWGGRRNARSRAEMGNTSIAAAHTLAGCLRVVLGASRPGVPDWQSDFETLVQCRAPATCTLGKDLAACSADRLVGVFDVTGFTLV